MNTEVLTFPQILDERGNLSFIEGENHIPFTIQRVYWIYDVPGGGVRGGHAYKELEEVIIALSGSFDVIVNKNTDIETKFHLNRPYEGLYIPKMTWRQIQNYSTNSVSLILASREYNPNDYIYDYKVFNTLLKKKI